MLKFRKTWAILGVLAIGVYACSKDLPIELPPDPPDPPNPPVTDTVTSPVVFDPATVPYQSLSEYHFFDGAMANHKPVFWRMIS